ncbi:DUF488 domain-containing protein [Pendulispora brunnea]|uniref:DUF488 domain-containing protein n=1 Tax=Pendulispora brunnea TaxID=2905690 RepID=A0ABZ2KK50_9BACT
MKTACFKYEGPGRISIARSTRGVPKGFRHFHRLAPGPWFNEVSEQEYRALFDRDMLGRLDPQATWDALHALVAPHEPILLCWEKPPLTTENWCHRRIVAEWFEKHLGVKVPELGSEPQGVAVGESLTLPFGDSAPQRRT